MAIKNTILHCAAVVLVLLGIVACASQRPVLSSNEHLSRVGAEAGERDIDECIKQAKVRTDGVDPSNNVVAGAATGSVVGAAAGGATGAIFGHAGRGAAAGAVGGVAGSLTQALLQGLFRRKPSQPSNEQVVESCLRQKATSRLGGSNSP
jgi:outer membrane lipoprotein SlyB